MGQRLLRVMRRTLVDQNIQPTNQNSILNGRNTTKKTSFRTAVTPIITDATRNRIPMIIIVGISKMPNISLYITSDIGFIGISVEENWTIPHNRKGRERVTDTVSLGILDIDFQ